MNKDREYREIRENIASIESIESRDSNSSDSFLNCISIKDKHFNYLDAVTLDKQIL